MNVADAAGAISFKQMKYRIKNLQNLFPSSGVMPVSGDNNLAESSSQVNSSIFASNKSNANQTKQYLMRKNSTQNIESNARCVYPPSTTNSSRQIYPGVPVVD